MTKDKALEMALQLIIRINRDGWVLADFEPEMYACITAIKEALETKDEPVAIVISESGANVTHSWWHEPALPIGTKLYTSPQCEWVGLTDEEIYEIYGATERLVGEHWDGGGTILMFPTTLYEAFETKLKEKNT